MKKSDIGLIGLGTMGAMLALNIADNGYQVSVFNRTVSTTKSFTKDAGHLSNQIHPCETLAEFIGTIVKPRAIILMVPAGMVVDNQIASLTPLLEKNDVIIDAGNANFHDTDRRVTESKKSGIAFLGIGISGGEYGARHGPSIMVGGSKKIWGRVSHIFEAIAAKHSETPCVTWMGEGGAGHFVKTVHNGIEYADMQMISEIYGIMRDGMKLDNHQISQTFAKWNNGPLKSYLIEITSKVSAVKDVSTGQPILDLIIDRAGQKGTGRWTAIEAQHLGSPIPVIEAAVTARNLSAHLKERKKGEVIYGPAPKVLPSGTISVEHLESALVAGKILCYAQGFALMSSASSAFGWHLPLADIAKVWREGCIIRSSMLNDMANALAELPSKNLIFAPFFIDILTSTNDELRDVVTKGMQNGLAVPALASALSYFDSMRTSRSTANMIQAQRDFFGAHSFERFDKPGIHHGPWSDST